MPANRFFPRPAPVLALALGLATGALLIGSQATADVFSGSSRAAWLWGRINQDQSGQYFQQDEFGYVAAAKEEDSAPSAKRDHSPWLLLASAVVPGSGELLMGHWINGVGLIAADAFCWYKGQDAGDEGRALEDDFYDFADAHWFEDNLFQAYYPASIDLMRAGGIGLDYFDLTDDYGNPVSSMATIDQLRYLSLWVSKEDDRREYYENLGKWDQFVFGWDDFVNPNYPPAGYEDFEPTYALSDLRQPWTSYNRETYRDLREAANDAFKREDRYRYVNIGLRLFSVLEVAYLQGLLGGRDDKFEVSGHQVRILAEPGAWGRSTLAAQVSF